VLIALIIAVSAVSLAAIFFKLAAPTHPLIASAWRLLLAGAVLAPLTARALRRGALTDAQARAGVVAGALYAAHYGAWVWSLGLTSVAASVTLVCVTPLGLALWGWLTGRDAPTRRQVVGMCVASLGVVGLSASDYAGAAQGALLGDVLAIAGALTIGGYMLLARRLGPTLDVVAYSGVACLSGALFLFTAGALIDAPLTPPGAAQWAAIIACALIPQLIGQTLLTWSLRHVTPTVAAIAVLGEPVLTTALAVPLLGESASGVTLAACAVILLGVGISLRGGAST
jgi:drug/metabolite transporter (DMT)-like permease